MILAEIFDTSLIYEQIDGLNKPKYSVGYLGVFGGALDLYLFRDFHTGATTIFVTPQTVLLACHLDQLMLIEEGKRKNKCK